MPPLMLPSWCLPLPTTKIWKGETFRRVEEKLDGWSLAIVVEERAGAKRVRAFTTGLDDISSLLREQDWFSQMTRLPAQTVVVGEMLATRDGRFLPASAVPTALRRAQGLTFVAFGLPAYNGNPVCTFEEVASLLVASQIQQVRSFPVQARERTPVATSERASYLDHFYNLAREAGVEGVVLKTSPYEGWFKVKVERTIDAVILGFKPGTGRNAGSVGSIVVGVYDDRDPSKWNVDPEDAELMLAEGARPMVELAAAGGLSDVVRDRLNNASSVESLVGSAIEVRYQYVGAGGRLRHPRFVRFREDKAPHDCVLSQLDQGAA